MRPGFSEHKLLEYLLVDDGFVQTAPSADLADLRSTKVSKFPRCAELRSTKVNKFPLCAELRSTKVSKLPRCAEFRSTKVGREEERGGFVPVGALLLMFHRCCSV